MPNIRLVTIDPLCDRAKSSLDSIALDIMSCNRWDSDYPQMNFSGGFSSLTQLTADEKVGKLMLLWVIMHTQLSMDIITKYCHPLSQCSAAATRFSSHTHDIDEAGKNEESNQGDQIIHRNTAPT